MMRFTPGGNNGIPAPFGLRDQGPAVFSAAADQATAFHTLSLQQNQSMENVQAPTTTTRPTARFR